MAAGEWESLGDVPMQQAADDPWGAISQDAPPADNLYGPLGAEPQDPWAPAGEDQAPPEPSWLERVGTKLAEKIGATKSAALSHDRSATETLKDVGTSVRANLTKQIAGMQVRAYNQRLVELEQSGLPPDPSLLEARDKALAVAAETDTDLQGVGSRSTAFDRIVQNAASSTATSAGALAVGLTARMAGVNPSLAGGAGALAIGPPVGGATYVERILKGDPHDKAELVAQIDEGAEVLTELIPTARLLDGVGRTYIQKLLRFAVAELPGETAAHYIQTLNNGIADVSTNAPITPGVVAQIAGQATRQLPEVWASVMLSGAAQTAVAHIPDMGRGSQQQPAGNAFDFGTTQEEADRVNAAWEARRSRQRARQNYEGIPGDNALEAPPTPALPGPQPPDDGAGAGGLPPPAPQLPGPAGGNPFAVAGPDVPVAAAATDSTGAGPQPANSVLPAPEALPRPPAVPAPVEPVAAVPDEPDEPKEKKSRERIAAEREVEELQREFDAHSADSTWPYAKEKVTTDKLWEARTRLNAIIAQENRAKPPAPAPKPAPKQDVAPTDEAGLQRWLEERNREVVAIDEELRAYERETSRLASESLAQEWRPEDAAARPTRYQEAYGERYKHVEYERRKGLEELKARRESLVKPMNEAVSWHKARNSPGTLEPIFENDTRKSVPKGSRRAGPRQLVKDRVSKEPIAIVRHRSKDGSYRFEPAPRTDKELRAALVEKFQYSSWGDDRQAADEIAQFARDWKAGKADRDRTIDGQVVRPALPGNARQDFEQRKKLPDATPKPKGKLSNLDGLVASHGEEVVAAMREMAEAINGNRASGMSPIMLEKYFPQLQQENEAWWKALDLLLGGAHPDIDAGLRDGRKIVLFVSRHKPSDVTREADLDDAVPTSELAERAETPKGAAADHAKRKAAGKPLLTESRTGHKRLLCTSCSKKKDRDEGWLPAEERYAPGKVMNLMGSVPAKHRPDILFLSAKYGLIEHGSKIKAYEQELSKAAADKLIKDTKYRNRFIATLAQYRDGKVLIAAGGEYRRVFEAWVEQGAKQLAGIDLEFTDSETGFMRQAVKAFVLEGIPSGSVARAAATEMGDTAPAPQKLDPRFRRRQYREAVQGAANALVEGGGIGWKETGDGYSSSMNPDWGQLAADVSGLSYAKIKNAAAKLVAGKPLGAAETRAMNSLLEAYLADRKIANRPGYRALKAEKIEQKYMDLLEAYTLALDFGSDPKSVAALKADLAKMRARYPKHFGVNEAKEDYRVERPVEKGAWRQSRVLNRDHVALLPAEKKALAEFLKGRKDRARILKMLEQHRGTPWAKQAIEGMFTRQAAIELMAGREPAFASALDDPRSAKTRRQLARRGIEGLWALMESNKFLSAASKPVNNVSSSFVNCSPSDECAKYCYATGGNFRWANVIIKGELVTLAVESDPRRAADITARQYKATRAFVDNKALRLFDKGDLGQGWLEFVQGLNEAGVRVQIFSRQPELLRKIPDKNVRMLSIDKSNPELADQNPDLPVAFIYSGPSDLPSLTKLFGRGQVQVVLPIQVQGRELLDMEGIRQLRNAIKGIAPYICPIDAGYKPLLTNKQPNGWNCLKCDAKGGLGCFFGQPTKGIVVEAYPKAVKWDPELEDIVRRINAYFGEDEETLAEPGRLPAGQPPRLNRQAVSLLSRLMAEHDGSGKAADREVGDDGARGHDGQDGEGRPRSRGVREGSEAYGSDRWYYSPVTRAIANAKLEKATGSQWMGYLLNQPGVKREELDDLYLTDYFQTLDLGGVKATKQAVLDGALISELELTDTVLVGNRSHYWNQAEQDGAVEVLREYGIIVDANEMDGEPAFQINGEGPEWIPVWSGTVVSKDGLGEIANDESDPNSEDAERILDQIQAIEKESIASAKYEEYALEGGEDYFELLIGVRTLPSERMQASLETARNDKQSAIRKPIFEKWNPRINVARLQLDNWQLARNEPESLPPDYRIEELKLNPDYVAALDPDGDTIKFLFVDTESDRKAAIAELKSRAWLHYSERLEQLRDNEADQALFDAGLPEQRESDTKKFRFTEGHFGDRGTNTIIHVRAKTRMTADGKKVLAVEEFQSDIHKRGRRAGYMKPGDTDRANLAYARGKSLERNVRRLIKAEDNLGYDNANDAIRDLRQNAMEPETIPGDWQMSDELRRAVLEWRRSFAEYTRATGNSESVPDAPFKKSHYVLAMKRAMRWAAENGFDYVAWTPGEVQGERYNALTHVTKVSVSRVKGMPDVVRLQAVPKDAADAQDWRNFGRIARDRLGDYIGPELAKEALRRLDAGEGGATPWYRDPIIQTQLLELERMGIKPREDMGWHVYDTPDGALGVGEMTANNLPSLWGNQVREAARLTAEIQRKIGGTVNQSSTADEVILDRNVTIGTAKGYKDLYDNVLVQEANRIVKRFGGKATRIKTADAAKVEHFDIYLDGKVMEEGVHRNNLEETLQHYSKLYPRKVVTAQPLDGPPDGKPAVWRVRSLDGAVLLTTRTRWKAEKKAVEEGGILEFEGQGPEHEWHAVEITDKVRAGLLAPIAVYEQKDLFGLQPGRDRQSSPAPEARPVGRQADMFGLVDPKAQARADRERGLDLAKERTESKLRGDKSVPADLGIRGDLFTTQKDLLDAAAKLPERPGTTPKQRTLREGSLEWLADKIGGGQRGVRVVGSDFPRTLAAGFTVEGSLQLVGQKASTPRELALIAQVYRHPTFETLRWIVTKGDKVVYETGLSSRLAAAVHFGDNAGKLLAELANAMSDLGGDGWYLLHNHPSGQATPSDSDIMFTQSYADAVRGFRGHVVIDHSEYGFIDAKGRADVRQLPGVTARTYGRDALVPHALLGQMIRGPRDVAWAARNLEMPAADVVTIVGTGRGRIRSIVSIPAKELRGARGIAMLRRISRWGGAQRMFAVVESDFGPVEHLLNNGILFDAARASDEVAWSSENNEAFTTKYRERDLRESGGGTDRLGSRFVREGDEPGTLHVNPLMPLYRRYQRLAQRVIDRWNDKVGWRWDALGKLPRKENYLTLRYQALGKLTKVREVSRNVYDALAQADAADQRAVYDYLTTAGANPAGIRNLEVRRKAVAVKKLIDRIGRTLVLRGMLSSAAYAKYKDAYLPRLYLKHILGESNFASLGSGRRLSDLGYLKRRKNLPLDERVLLGEILDPAFLASHGIAKTMRDLAIMDFLNALAPNGDWVAPQSLVTWRGRQVSPFWLKREADSLRQRAELYGPQNKAFAQNVANQMDATANAGLAQLANISEEFKQLPDTPRYGILRGAWVRREIHNDLVGAMRAIPSDRNVFEQMVESGGIGTKITQLWKQSKVALNPPAQVRNFISNMMLVHLSGVAMYRIPVLYVRAINELRTHGKYWRIARKYGLFESTFTNTELLRIEEEWLDLQRRMGQGNAMATIKAMGAILANKSSDVYQLSESIGKIAKLIDGMENDGLSESDAMIEAHKWLFDYSLVPRVVGWARNAPIGVPFITFYYKATARLGEALVKHPARFLPYLAIGAMMAGLLKEDWDLDEEEAEKLRQAMPDWIRERSHVWILPWKDEHGRWQVLDFGYLVPWGVHVEVGKALGAGDAKKGAETLGIMNGPIVSIIAAYKTGIDPWTKRPIYPEGATKKEQLIALLDYSWSLAAPPFVTSNGWLGKTIDATTGQVNPRTGEPGLTAWQAQLRLMGINIYPVDPAESRQRNILMMKREIEDVERALGKRLRDKNLSPAEKAEIRETYRAIIRQKQEDLAAYQKASAFPRRLMAPTPPAKEPAA